MSPLNNDSELSAHSKNCYEGIHFPSDCQNVKMFTSPIKDQTSAQSPHRIKPQRNSYYSDQGEVSSFPVSRMHSSGPGQARHGNIQTWRQPRQTYTPYPIYRMCPPPQLISPRQSLHYGVNVKTSPPRGRPVPFPDKLYQLIEDAEVEGKSDIISFFPHGRAFVIHDPARFSTEIMPRFFKQTKLASFQRQLNLYGFRRISRGPDSGGYYHAMFIRGRPDLCPYMRRTKVRGQHGGKLNREDPNFYVMSPIDENYFPSYDASSYPLTQYHSAGSQYASSQDHPSWHSHSLIHQHDICAFSTFTGERDQRNFTTSERVREFPSLQYQAHYDPAMSY